MAERAIKYEDEASRKTAEEIQALRIQSQRFLRDEARKRNGARQRRDNVVRAYLENTQTS